MLIISGGFGEVNRSGLYGIMQHYYNALPVVPKIFYKQNAQDNAKGADSVHIVLEGDTDFSLWFGEAKFYSSIEDKRLDAILISVKNSLETEKLRKENSIITNVNDLMELVVNQNLRVELGEFLSADKSMDLIKPKIHIPILLLHACEITKQYNTFSKDYIEKLIEE